MSKNYVNELSVIIRSVGERTETLCIESVLCQGVSKDDLHIVKIAPFSRALEDSFRLASRLNKEWTLCLDADVILRPNSIHQLLEFSEKQNANVFEIQGMVWDKFFGGPRPAGNHLYRTKYLNKALNFISHDPTILRPENHVLLKMKEIGFPWRQLKYCVGVHDFEQYNRDIFRKAMLHSVKHSNFFSLFLSHWSENSEDEDFIVSLDGFLFGLKQKNPIFCDMNTEIPKIDEKGEINTSEFNLNIVESVLKSKVNKHYLTELARIGKIPNSMRLKGLVVVYRILKFLERKVQAKINKKLEKY